MHYKKRCPFFSPVCCWTFFFPFLCIIFFPDRVQKYNSIRREKTFDSSSSANPISPSLKWWNVHLQIRVEVKDKGEVSVQREETWFQANIHGTGYNLNEEAKQTKIPNIRKKEALSLENWENEDNSHPKSIYYCTKIWNIPPWNNHTTFQFTTWPD